MAHYTAGCKLGGSESVRQTQSITIGEMRIFFSGVSAQLRRSALLGPGKRLRSLLAAQLSAPLRRAALGELHLERCLKDLRERYCRDVQLAVSEQISARRRRSGGQSGGVRDGRHYYCDSCNLYFHDCCQKNQSKGRQAPLCPPCHERALAGAGGRVCRRV